MIRINTLPHYMRANQLIKIIEKKPGFKWSVIGNTAWPTRTVWKRNSMICSLWCFNIIPAITFRSMKNSCKFLTTFVIVISIQLQEDKRKELEFWISLRQNVSRTSPFERLVFAFFPNFKILYDYWLIYTLTNSQVFTRENKSWR